LNDFTTKFLKIFILFGTTVITARALGPENLGYTKYIILIVSTAAQFGNLGIIDATSYFQRKSSYDIRKIFNVNLSFLFILSFFLIALFTFLKLSGLIFLEYSNEIVIYISFMIIFFGFFNDLIVATLISKENIYRINNSLLLTSFINLIVMAVLWHFDLLSVTVYLIIFPVSTVLRTYMMLKKIEFRYKFDFDFKIISEEIKYGFIVFLGAFFIYLNYRFDQWLVKFYLGNKQLGLYGAGVGIAEIILIIPTSVINPLRSRLYNLKTGSDEFKSVTAKTVKFALYTTAAVSIPIFFAVNFLSSDFLYGPKYYDSILVVQILLSGIIFITFGKIGSHYYVVKGKPAIHMVTSLFIFILNLALNLYLIPAYGIAGAAVSSTISYTVYGLIYIYLFIRIENFSPSELFVINRNEIAIFINNAKKIKSFFR
jgi:O-antigen/teichoic acid export membrane protein